MRIHRSVFDFTVRAAAAVLILLCASSAAAEERFGVPVYPGATYDPALTKTLMKDPAVRGAAYRTGDALEKVAAFYRGRGLVFVKQGAPSGGHARFKHMERNADVVIRRPWKDPRSGKPGNDTLILILRENGR